MKTKELPIFLLCLLLILTAANGFAQSIEAAPGAIPAAALLNPDGTINTSSAGDRCAGQTYFHCQ